MFSFMHFQTMAVLMLLLQQKPICHGILLQETTTYIIALAFIQVFMGIEIFIVSF